MTSVIILGPPGVGKGTQSGWLAKALDVPAISTGQIFRANIADETELGKLADHYISRGEFVPDSVTTPMVAVRLSAPDVRDHGFVLDGYPRTLAQGHSLRDILAAERLELDVVLELSAGEDLLVERMLYRAGLEGRSDDNVETFSRRLHDYHALTEPLATYYADQDLLEVIDASGTREEVAANMMEALRARGLLSTDYSAD